MCVFMYNAVSAIITNVVPESTEVSSCGFWNILRAALQHKQRHVRRCTFGISRYASSPVVVDTGSRCIPIHNYFPVYFLCFYRSSFTSKTPNEIQEVEQLFYRLFVCVL